MISRHTGDVFSSTHSLAHCVSADARMSAGIAKQFVSYFPILLCLRSEHNIVGTAIPVCVGGRTIYNMVTKNCFWMKPTRFSMANSLRSMLAHAVAVGITDISMPEIGGGRDKMNFVRDVLPIIFEVFDASSVNIHVYKYPFIPGVTRYVIRFYF